MTTNAVELPPSQGLGKLIHCAHEAEQGKIEGGLLLFGIYSELEDLETEPWNLIPNSTLNLTLSMILIISLRCVCILGTYGHFSLLPFPH